MHIFGSSIAICRISLRFFSPPEKPTLTGRFSISASIFSALAFSRTTFRKSPALISSSPRALRCAFTRGAQEGHVADAGNFHRILERQEQPRRRPLFRLHRQQVLPVQRGGAFGHLIAVAPRQHIGQRRFARPVRPHDRMHFARPDRQVDARAG